MRSILVIFLTFCLCFASYGQFISVLKPGTKKRLVYTVGDAFFFRHSNTFYGGQIMAISDTMLIINDTVFTPESIEVVYDYSKRWFAKQGTGTFPVAGFSYFTLTTINRLINNNKPTFNRRNLIPAAGLIALGAICYPFRRRTFNLSKNAKLTILE